MEVGFSISEMLEKHKTDKEDNKIGFGQQSEIVEKAHSGRMLKIRVIYFFLYTNNIFL